MTEENKAAVPEEAKKEEEKPAEAEPAKEEKVEEPASEVDPSQQGGAEVEVPKEFQKIVDEIEGMSVLQLNELVKVFEAKFGVSATAVAAVGAGGGDAGAAEEKDEFTVDLKSAGDQKIAVIKAVKEVLGLGLKEAKDLVESAPATLKEGVSKDEADELKAKLEEAGAQVELK